MQTIINAVSNIPKKSSIVLLLNNISNKIEKYGLTKDEVDYIKKQHEKSDKNLVAINKLGYWIFVQFIKKDDEHYFTLENCRKAGDSLLSTINDNKIETITVVDVDNKPSETIAFAEGMALGNYQFLKYFKDTKDKANSLKSVNIISKVKPSEIEEVNTLISAVHKVKTLVNEPSSYLTAEKLSEEIESMGREACFKVEVMNKMKIESLKMGGILAVNLGSLEPPTFTITEWKPKNYKNKKPYIFVGKGVVFDTGGINLKPSSALDGMKCDMAGAAAVAGVMYAIAKAKLPVWVIGLMPATDNRPDGNAQVPGDVIKMYDGTTVEVLNTDAEGRLILADALSYAKKYNPELVIDLATLTGAAHAAIGKYGTVAMGSKSAKEMLKLKESGNNVYERIVEFPFWKEYEELLKSDIADLKNIGGHYGGAITAGKFLERFTDYPWIHLDIAGSAYVDSRDSYRGKGGTGVGVRLLFDFIKNKCK